MTFMTQSVKISTLTLGASLDWGESMGVLTTRTGERSSWWGGWGGQPIPGKQACSALTKDCATLL